MMRLVHWIALTALAAAGSSSVSAAVIDVGAQAYLYSLYTRGYYFTAPVDFTITGLSVQVSPSAGSQNIQVVRFGPTPIPENIDGTQLTNDFTSLALILNDATPGFIATNIAIHSGDVIGILGDRGGVNSYANGPYLTSIAGSPTTLNRLAYEDHLSNSPAYDLFTEDPLINDRYSRVRFTYTTASLSAAPEPTTWAMMIIGFGGVGSLMRRQSRSRPGSSEVR